LAAGLPRAPRKWRMPEIDAAGAPAAAFDALFSAALAQVGVNSAGMRSSRDPEYLHQLRVGLRRLRSALRAFAPILKDVKPLTRSMRAFMPALGAARDWDVFTERLGAVRTARARREPARRAAVAVVASQEFQAFLFHSLRWLQSRPWREPEATLRDFAPDRLEGLHRRTVEALGGKSARRRHKLRIRVKRLRYACEFFAPCFPAAALEPYIGPLAALQDVLGELNDIAVARRFLKALDAGAPKRLDAREGQLIAALRAARERFESAPQYWRPPG
jgi:triphosphatase